MLFLFVEERNEFVSFHYWHVIQYRRRDSGEFLCKRIPSDIKIIQIRSMKLYNIILMSIKDETENEFNAISRLKCAPLYADSSLIRPLFESTADNWCAREMWQLKLDTSKLYFRHFFERLRLRISIVICSSSRVWMFDLSTPWSFQRSSLRNIPRTYQYYCVWLDELMWSFLIMEWMKLF